MSNLQRKLEYIPSDESHAINKGASRHGVVVAEVGQQAGSIRPRPLSLTKRL